MKLKFLYAVSFWFGIIYAVLKLLWIPGMLILLRAEGVSFALFTYVISTNSFSANLAYFGSLLSGILIGVLIATISLSLVRNKISANKMINAGIIMVSIVALVMVVFIIISIVLVILSPSIQTPLSISGQVSKIAYPVFTIFFFVSVLLLTAGYIKEELKVTSKKDFKIILTSSALIVIILINIAKIFH